MLRLASGLMRPRLIGILSILVYIFACYARVPTPSNDEHYDDFIFVGGMLHCLLCVAYLLLQESLTPR